MSSSRLRTLLGVALLSMAVPCVGFGLPIVALTVAGLAHAYVRAAAPEAPSRAVWPLAIAVSAFVVAWWMAVALVLDAELGVGGRAVAAAGALVVGLACAPLALSLVATVLPASEPVWVRGFRLAARLGPGRVRGVGAVVLVAAVVPVLALPPLLGFVIGATALAIAIPWSLSWAVRELAAETSPDEPSPPSESATSSAARFAGASVLFVLAVLLAVLLVPLPLAEGEALGPGARGLAGAVRVPDTQVTIEPHAEGLVVSVADGGGVGLVRWAHGRPDRFESTVLARPADRRVCVERAGHVGCLVVGSAGVRRDDGYGERAGRRIGRAWWLALLALGLASVLGTLGARASKRTFGGGLVVLGALLTSLALVGLSALL